MLGCEVVTSLAAATGRTPAQVVLRWAVQRGTVPLPRSTTPSRITENFAGVLDWVLTEGQMAALDGLDASDGSAGRIMRGDHLVQVRSFDLSTLIATTWCRCGNVLPTLPAARAESLPYGPLTLLSIGCASGCASCLQEGVDWRTVWDDDFDVAAAVKEIAEGRA